jgi:oligoendopeptidase F
VDWAENEGKRSGAFSWGTYDSNPVIHMTWTGTLDNVFTLAHELGHSMHTFLSNRAQPYHLASYTIFVAEVASTLNEALLADHILTREPTTELGKEVLSQTLEGFEGTVLRQVLFATFERDAAAKVDEAIPLGPDEFDALYLALNKEWYGAEGGGLPLVAHEWMRIPHFYSTFYVYKYATSYCASAALLEALKENPTAARGRVMGLLQAGGSKPPMDILRDAGVDFSTPAPVERAFQTYKRNVDRARAVFVDTRHS